ncbi:hypothetical protein [Treponema sp.]|uniref:hypothetical protein n=1 Tax=Treponema sp. TaxID=166 RepID=UPI00298E9139|nr:hypothetical protein [Treponema sp.]
MRKSFILFLTLILSVSCSGVVTGPENGTTNQSGSVINGGEVTQGTSGHYINSTECIQSNWNEIVEYFQPYCGKRFEPEVGGDCMRFYIENGELYFMYGFLNGVCDESWDEEHYQDALNIQLDNVDIENYMVPPTAGRIVAFDNTVSNSENGIMLLLAADHHYNWVDGYCYEETNTGYGNSGSDHSCYIPFYIVLYPDGIHIKQACYVGYDVVKDGGTMTACFRYIEDALENLPYDRGDWTYATEYASRSVLDLNVPSGINGYFRAR